MGEANRGKDPAGLLRLTAAGAREETMAAPRREIRLDDLMEPISHYTDAVLCGDFLFMSGAGPFDKDGRLIGEGDVVKQCEATCENIDRMLSAADMSPSDVVYFKVLMEEVYDGPKINPVRIAFHGDSYPGSTRVGVGHLALPGMLLEIECVAYKPRDGGAPKQEIRCENLFEPPSHYIDVVKCGDYAFVSGTGPIAADGRAVHFGDPEKQAFKTLENMEVMLEAAGMGFEDVCKVVCYLENVVGPAEDQCRPQALLRRQPAREHAVRHSPAGHPGHEPRDRGDRLPARRGRGRRAGKSASPACTSRSATTPTRCRPAISCSCRGRGRSTTPSSCRAAT